MLLVITHTSLDCVFTMAQDQQQSTVTFPLLEYHFKAASQPGALTPKHRIRSLWHQECSSIRYQTLDVSWWSEGPHFPARLSFSLKDRHTAPGLDAVQSNPHTKGLPKVQSFLQDNIFQAAWPWWSLL
jgi:hypothetical protein